MTTPGPEEGLANFSIKISRKGAGLETSYSILPKVRKVPQKIVDQWASEKETIWLPNFFGGKDPFDGKQVDKKVYLLVEPTSVEHM